MQSSSVKNGVATYAKGAYGFWRQIDPKPFQYTMEYKGKQSTNLQMVWLRLGWLSSHIPHEKLRAFKVVDIGSGNGTFVKEARKAKVFASIAPYDLTGETIDDVRLYSESWDLVVMSDVLEHYEYIDDLWLLNFKYALISFPEAPGGIPLEEWRHYKPDEHIYCLNAKGFAEWVQDNKSCVIAKGCPEDMLRKRWDSKKVNITTVLIKKK